MYHDDEIAYKDWTLAVYQSERENLWCCDYWYSGSTAGGTITDRRRKAVIEIAKKIIDAMPKD